MKHEILRLPCHEAKVDAMVLGLFGDGALTAVARDLDGRLGGLLTHLMASGEFSGKQGELLPLHRPPGLSAKLLVLVGLGPRASYGPKQAFRSAGTAAKFLSDKARPQALAMFPSPQAPEEADALVAGFTVGCHGQDLYREVRARFPFHAVLWPLDFEPYLGRSMAIAEAVQLARRLVNEPPDTLDPVSFAEQAMEVADACGIAHEVWDETRLEQEKCGALLAVARGSMKPPRLVILRYFGKPAEQDASSTEGFDLALVGKGVTFDSGGLSLKPSDGMLTMKSDMAGAATMLAALQAIARLRLPLRVLGVLGLVENMPGGLAYKLGDVLHTRKGITIEVRNTDAEGRLVLADALDVAVKLRPQAIVDAATLTGACVVALGNDVAGLMSNHDPLLSSLTQAAHQCGELVWPLPMFPEFEEQIKSDIADLKNTGNGRWGGAITAAKLLERFVDPIPWVHIDLAGPSFVENGKPWQDGGGTGVMVRSLVRLAESISRR